MGNVDTLYPSPSGQRASNKIKISSSHYDDTENDTSAPTRTPKMSSGTTFTSTTTASPSSDPSSTKSSSSTKKDAASSSCSVYPKCVDVGLTGECCPTQEGVKLDCCI